MLILFKDDKSRPLSWARKFRYEEVLVEYQYLNLRKKVKASPHSKSVKACNDGYDIISNYWLWWISFQMIVFEIVATIYILYSLIRPKTHLKFTVLAPGYLPLRRHHEIPQKKFHLFAYMDQPWYLGYLNTWMRLCLIRRPCSYILRLIDLHSNDFHTIDTLLENKIPW